MSFVSAPRWSFLRLPALMAALLLLGACSGPPREHKETLYIFGTLMNMDVITNNDQLAQRANIELTQEFERMHHQWHGWKPLGELYKINQEIAAGKKEMPVTPGLAKLILDSKKISKESMGLFNPAIGKLIGLWGFHQDTLPTGNPPSKKAIDALMAHHPSMEDIDIKDGKLISHNPYVQMDFGGIGKGYGIEIAEQHLRKMGIKDAMLNAGGDLCGMGEHINRPWRVGIRQPRGGKGVIAWVDITDGECVLTSGNYERYLKYKGKRYPHIIDPRTGMPVQQIASSTVIDQNGGLADAAATALSVAGSKEWYQVARSMGLKYVMLVDEKGTVYMNPAMAKRIHFEDPKPANIIISPPLQGN